LLHRQAHTLAVEGFNPPPATTARCEIEEVSLCSSASPVLLPAPSGGRPRDRRGNRARPVPSLRDQADGRGAAHRRPARVPDRWLSACPHREWPCPPTETGMYDDGFLVRENICLSGGDTIIVGALAGRVKVTGYTVVGARLSDTPFFTY